MASILVIDDEDLARDVLRAMLAAAGHDVRVSADGESGLQEYRGAPSDLVIADMFMPGIDGIELIERLRAEAPQAKVLFMSGGGQRDDRDVLEVARSVGADHVLAKPFTRAELLEAVDEVLS